MDHTTERVGISVKGGNIEIYDMTNNVIIHVIEHDNKEVYLVEKNKEGKIRSRAAGGYSNVVPVKDLILCDHCHKPTIFVTDGERCGLCNAWICKNCVDWECMAKTKTEQIVCKECSKLFKNCKGGN